jgi:hypothetical protein
VPTRVARRTKAGPQPCAAAIYDRPYSACRRPPGHAVWRGRYLDLGPVWLGYLDSNQEPCASEAPALPNCAIPHRPRVPLRADKEVRGAGLEPANDKF